MMQYCHAIKADHHEKELPMSEPTFSPQDAHEHFSKQCFNQAWDLIDQPVRTPEENERMIQLAHASVWHWSERPDCKDKHLSIGYWQLSRIYALVGDGRSAAKYAKLCFEKTPQDDPFSMGYAYEALARAESVTGNKAQAQKYLSEAKRLANNVSKDNEKQMLVKDLESI
jgi:ATP/maltotriose-dependent transcriptional regulator MalT